LHASRLLDVGERDVNEVGAGAAVARAATEGAWLGPRVPADLDAAVACDAPAHHRADAGAVWPRRATVPRGLPRVHLVRGPVVVAVERPVRVLAALGVAGCD